MVDAVLAVKTTNDKGEIKYPIKVGVIFLLKMTALFPCFLLLIFCHGCYGTGNQHSQCSWKEC